MRKLNVFIASLVILSFILSGCMAMRPKSSTSAPRKTLKDVEVDESLLAPPAASAGAKKAAIVVDTKDLESLNKMNKAVEDYVLKSDPKAFADICQQKTFDCFVGGKSFPASKKKIKRKVPPYASGSKMGLQGEERVQIKYDFYP